MAFLGGGILLAGCAGISSPSIPKGVPPQAPYDEKPSWSPDGSALAFIRGEGETLRVIDTRSGAKQVLLEGMTWNDEYVWSPDGQSLAVTSRRDGVTSKRCFGVRPCPELYVVYLDDRSPRRITHNRTYEQAPRWSPDGRQLAFLSGHDPSDQRAWRDVWITDLVRGTSRQLTEDASIEQELQWARNGRALVVTIDDGNRFELFMDRRRRALAPELEQPVSKYYWETRSPRSRVVAYVSTQDRNGRSCGIDSGPPECEPNGELYLRLPSGRQLRVTHTRVDETYPTWSPDGRTLAFSSGGQLWLVEADGSHLRRLTG